MNASTENTIEGAIVEVKPDTALVTIDPAKYAAAAFESYKKEFQAAKRAATKAGTFDITTSAGMKQAKELRASFRTIRTAIENARKAAKAPVIEAGKKIDEVAKEFTAEVEPHEDKYDQAVKAEEKRQADEKAAKEAAERARIEAIESRIAHIRAIPVAMGQAASEAITAKIEELLAKRLEPAMYEEHLEAAVNALNDTIDQLRELHTLALTREADARRAAEERAELERLRAENEERERRQAQRDAEERSRLEAVAAEQAELRAKLAAAEAMLAALQAPKVEPVAEPEPAPAPAAELSNAAVVATLESRPLLAPEQPINVTIEGAGQTIHVTNHGAGLRKTARPSDADLVDVLAKHFEVTDERVVSWLADFDFVAYAVEVG